MMFAAPAQLLWLLVLPLLWWLMQPPRPRQQLWTPHFEQWQAALAARRQRPPRAFSLRFLLLALATVAVVAAMAGPFWPGQPGPLRLVALLDRSASMAAVSAAGETAAARAERALRQQFATLPDGVDVTVLAVGGDLRRRHGAAARALQDLGPVGGALAADLPAAAAAAAALPDTAVWTLTDGQGQTALPTAGALTVLSAAGPNGALLGVAIEDRWPLPELRLTASCAVFAAASAPAPAQLAVAGACQPVAPLALSFAAGAMQTVAIDLVRTAAGGPLELALRLPGDVLAADDVWRCVLPALPAPRIAVLADAEAGPFAAAAARALAAEVGGEVVAGERDEAVGLLLVDGGRIALQPGAQRALTFGAMLGAGAVDGRSSPDPAASAVAPSSFQPTGIEWDRRSPLTAGLDLSELRLDLAWRGLLPDGEVFLWAEQRGERVPLGVVAPAAGAAAVSRASVHFGFALADGNLPLLAAFPQLLRRAFVRCYGPAAAIAGPDAGPAAGEQDLERPATGPDRPLPAFGRPATPLARWCVLAGLLLLAIRAWLR